MITPHEVRTYQAVQQSWATSREVASKAGVAERTARHHLRRLADAGVIERFEAFDGFRYRANPNPNDSAVIRISQLDNAAAVFRSVR